MIKKTLILLILILSTSAEASKKTPSIKLKLGQSAVSIDAGNTLDQEDLGSLLTFMPTVLWNFPSYRSRIGFHFLADLGSELGLMPISGIGASLYFYPWGVSSYYEESIDNVVQQSYKNSLYLMAGLTPANLNINQENEINPDASVSFSAFMVEGIVGAGYDYILRENVALSFSLNYRFASAVEENNDNESVSYSGITLFFSLTTTYF